VVRWRGFGAGRSNTRLIGWDAQGATAAVRQRAHDRGREGYETDAQNIANPGLNMGYHIHVDAPAETTLAKDELWGTRVGSYGSQDIAIGLFLTAYAVDRRSESERVRRWLEPYITGTDPAARTGWLERLAAKTGWRRWDYLILRRRPALVADLIAWGEDGCAWIVPNDKTIQRGLKLKPVQDPGLDALVQWWQRRNRFEGAAPGDDGRLDATLTARLADVCEALLGNLRPNPWYDNLAEITAVLRTAARRGAGVVYG